jgi:hypothetical protein
MLHYVLRSTGAANPVLQQELAAERFTDLDQARDVALSLCHEYGADIELVECFGLSEHVREVYDAATYA